MDTKKILADARVTMTKAVEFTLHEFSSLHTGKASPIMVESLVVQAYGSSMRLKEVAAITTPDARTIQIQPWDKGLLRDIEKALQVAKLVEQEKRMVTRTGIMSVPDAHLLLAMGRADAGVHVEHDPLHGSASMHDVDPAPAQVR